MNATVLAQPCHHLSGVGTALAEKLGRCNIQTLQDLLLHLPYRYQDRTRITAIRDVRNTDWCVVVGRICKVEIKQGKRPMLYCYLDDKTGMLRLRFFHYTAQQVRLFSQGTRICVFGEVREFANQFEMVHPEYQLSDNDTPFTVAETLTPIYSSTQGLTQSRLRQLVKKTLLTYKDAIEELEWMTPEQLNKLLFQPISEALACLHMPPPETALKALESGEHPALQRLVFDELLAQRLSLQFARQKRAHLKAPTLPPDTNLTTRFKALLPFTLTGAQERVSADIAHDLAQKTPMLRLVQGDVGSGKTIIAALAALQAIANGHQVALMAPTDLLSEQHLKTLHPWFQALGINILRLSGKMKIKERREVLASLESHACHFVIGTHALFQDNVVFARLGLIIIDEQHRFGVEQRLLLQQKGHEKENIPHQLLMTATPIPRTLAMSQLAHLDVSIIDELPKGRAPVITAVMNQLKRDCIIERLAAAFLEGRQAYWVCTLIEESEKLQCMAATASAEYLQISLPQARIGLVHGRMKSDEKEAVMRQFKAGELDLLVATTVIEVGVDVPNASLMIIENSERLGLSQLHQLRGRVGRGCIQSHCILLYQPPLSSVGIERLHIMKATVDGFIIAEKDLALRGAGEVLGTRQTGYHPYKIANLQRDHGLLPLIERVATQLMQHRPALAQAIAKRWNGYSDQFMHT